MQLPPFAMDGSARARPEVLIGVLRLQYIGEDTSPGLKRGGYINMVKRTIKCRCTGSAMPGSLVVDVGGMDIGNTVLLGDLQLPEGVTHAATELGELTQPICKIGGRAKREP